MAESENLLAVPSSDVQPMKRNRSMILPPSISELRVVILGNNWSEQNSVGNFLLGDTMFKPEEEPDYCQRANAPLKEKQIIVVNTPDLLCYNVSHHKLSDHMEACSNLSDPGPHVFLLVLQPQDFNEEQKQKLCRLLENFSKQSFNHALVLVSEPREEGSPEPMDKYRNHPPLKDMIRRCKDRYLWRQELERQELLTRLSQIVRENNCDHVICNVFERPAVESEGLTMSAPSEPVAPSLNLILCGRRGPMKTSAVKAILGQSAFRPVSSDCVQNKGKVCGRHVSMVELPPLHGKSQQAMEESFRCISLFDPVGVHAFILVVPVGPLTDEDKGELESLQSTFGSAVNVFILIVFSGKSTPMAESVEFVKEDREIQELCDKWGLRYIIITMENQKQISDMLQTVENMGFRCYTKDMFTKAQMDKLVTLQSQRMIEEGESSESLRAMKEETKRKDAELKRKDSEIAALTKENIDLRGKVDQVQRLKSELDETIQRERDERKKEKEEESRRRNKDEILEQEMRRKLEAAEKSAALERKDAESKIEMYRREMREDREAWDMEKEQMWMQRFQDQKDNLKAVTHSHKDLPHKHTSGSTLIYIFSFLSLLLVLCIFMIYGRTWMDEWMDGLIIKVAHSCSESAAEKVPQLPHYISESEETGRHLLNIEQIPVPIIIFIAVTVYKVPALSFVLLYYYLYYSKR